MLHDERDIPFIRHLALATVFVAIPAACLYVPGWFRWWWGVAYMATTGALFLGPYTLLLHNVSHRPLFKSRAFWLRQVVPWAWGPFFGQTPESYYAHHLGMHHAEGNMGGDLSSTLPFQRDSFVGFLRYWGRFMLVGTWELSRYLWTRRKVRLARRFLIGEALYFCALAALLSWNWRATFVVFVFPLILIRFLMLAGNWGQHAFIDPNDPANSYLNSLTCINSGYNRKCFNDGYHIGHHLSMTRHWTDMPGEFQANLDRYAREGAVVLKNIDFFAVWACLMLKRYDWLARCYVDLSGKGASEGEIVALLKSRTRAVPEVSLKLQAA